MLLPPPSFLLPVLAFSLFLLSCTVLQQPVVRAQEMSTDCFNAGLFMQSACDAEVKTATGFFNLQANSPVQTVDEAKLKSFINDNPPSTGCCAAATDFNAKRCSCSEVRALLKEGRTNLSFAHAPARQAMLSLIKSFIPGGDLSTYGKVGA